MLEVEGLSKTFSLAKSSRKSRKKSLPVTPDPREDGRSFHAISDISFTANKGAIVGLLGPNGAGKTTLLRVLSTALRPTRGTASFDGIDIVRDPLAVRRTLGFLSGNTGLYGRLTPREMLRYFGGLHGLEGQVLRDRVDELVQTLDMGHYVDRRNDTLSSGMKQKVSIGRTLIHDPPSWSSTSPPPAWTWPRPRPSCAWWSDVGIRARPCCCPPTTCTRWSGCAITW